ncbi:hypothetical protein [Cohnella cholangitidis]|uniref:Uncharacterized protein n=1 Tax=Cohnella cholangitidis TaxID=2598458 RepID=A0A7G5BVI4_9BACL|nr:hypothetical protein FPL14_06895 [Cohnella cholangitidis]
MKADGTVVGWGSNGRGQSIAPGGSTTWCRSPRDKIIHSR